MNNVKKSPITTHILDTTRGLPAENVPVTLEYFDGKWKSMGQGLTNKDGRVTDLIPSDSFKAGQYKIIFETQTYFSARKIEAFYPLVEIVFQIKNLNEHYHVPLLLNPYGYSTYRGS